MISGCQIDEIYGLAEADGGRAAQLLWCHNIIVSLPKLLAKSHSTDEQSRAVIKLYHYDVHMM